jgi:hypothetical protein
VEIRNSFAEGGEICVSWSPTGEHTGDGMGIAPNGARSTSPACPVGWQTASWWKAGRTGTCLG